MRVVGAAGAGALMFPRLTRASPNASPPQEQLAAFPEKTDLILRTDRPPQLETPLHYFRKNFMALKIFLPSTTTLWGPRTFKPTVRYCST